MCIVHEVNVTITSIIFSLTVAAIFNDEKLIRFDIDKNEISYGWIWRSVCTDIRTRFYIYIYKKIYRGLLNFEFQKLIIMDNIARTNFFIE